jgi:ABC-2 type transport system permease protein
MRVMGLASLIQKEIKELLRERTILVGVILLPLILFPVMGFTISIGMTSTVERLTTIDILYIDMDNGGEADRLAEVLEKSGLRLTRLENIEVEDLSSLLSEYGVRTAMVVPGDFTEKIESHLKPVVMIYTRIDSPTPESLQYISKIGSVIQSSGRKLGEELAASSGIDMEYYSSPYMTVSSLYYRGRVIEAGIETLAQLYFTINFTLPLVVLMVAATAGSVAATSVGLEKEAKTLEMLLTLPMSRIKILLAKLSGSIIIALLSTLSFMIGFTFYLSSIIRSQALASISQDNILQYIGLTPYSVILLGLTMGVALLITLGLGILAGVLAGDVRGGQQLAGLLQFPLFLIPFLALQFTEFQNLPRSVASALLADPITHIFLAIRAITDSNYIAATTHLTVTVFFMIAILSLAAWLFSGERLVTMRVRMRKSLE